MIERVTMPKWGLSMERGRLTDWLVAEGDDVVLVHGYGGDKNSWLCVQEPLAKTKIVHALDLPGHGESTKDVGDGSLDTPADAVLGFLDARGIGKAHLVGHSLGGAVVTKAAAKAPEKVERLTLIAPAGFSTAINADYLHDGVDKVLVTLLDTLLDGDEQAIDAARLLSTVDVPSKTVWGRQDAVLPPGTADVYVEDAGHLVHLEAPGAVIAAITC